MDIIFLDIDGVIRTDSSDKTNGCSHLPTFKRSFCKTSISNLNFITYTTRSKVVISSTWRTIYKIEELREIFKKNGATFDIIDYTPVLSNRGEEIQCWLDTNGTNSYVVIDDSIKDIVKHINPNRVVQTQIQIGLLDSNLTDKIIDILA